MRDQLELGLGEAADHVVPQLTASEDPNRDPLAGQTVLDLPNALGKLMYYREEVGADVWRGHDRVRPVGGGGGRQRDALVHRRGPVVDAGQQVEVDIRVVHLATDLRPLPG